jgi:undecaprenyl-diphosphatase
MWVITGTLLLVTDWRKKTRLGLRQFAVWQAALVGLAQAGAIMPGISRSGATICVAILVGLRRRWAVEFSFLIAIPAILGATVIKLVRDFGEISSGSLSLSSLVTGSAVAAVVGILALRLLIKASRSANLKFFAFYCYILACFVLIYSLK